MKHRYLATVPSGAIFTKSHCSINYVGVMKLQEEFELEYAGAILGSLIYLMNTFMKLTFYIRKLAKFMQYPVKEHFKIL